MSVNKVILLGNLGKDPEVRTLENGAKVVKFPLATSESYKDRNGNRVDRTEWHNVVLWRGLADIAEKFLRKGNPVYIEGKIRTRSWDDKDGNKRYITEIEADNLSLVGGRKDDSSGAGNNGNNSSAGSGSDYTSVDLGAGAEDDLPF